MTDSHSPAWERVQSLENLLALVSRADNRRRVILQQAWREGNWDQVYEEAKAMGRDMSELHAALAGRWRELMDDAQVEKHG